MRSSAHFSRGHVPVAFVFSVPGEKERRQAKPVAGDTGVNLESALVHLHADCPGLFPSTDRYDYRITNAFWEPIANSLGHLLSEARDTQIRDPRNIERVLGDLQGCELIILCGRKARLLATALKERGKKVVEVPHVGNKGLNVSYKVSPGPGLATSHARRERRVRLWTDDVFEAITSESEFC